MAWSVFERGDVVVVVVVVDPFRLLSSFQIMGHIVFHPFIGLLAQQQT